MELRKSALARVLLSLSKSSSMASVGASWFKTLRSTQTRFSSSFDSSSSSLRVPERLITASQAVERKTQGLSCISSASEVSGLLDQ